MMDPGVPAMPFDHLNESQFDKAFLSKGHPEHERKYTYL